MSVWSDLTNKRFWLEFGYWNRRLIPFHALFSTVLVSHLFFFYIFGCVSVVASAFHKQLVISKHKAAAVEKKRPPVVVQ